MPLSDEQIIEGVGDQQTQISLRSAQCRTFVDFVTDMKTLPALHKPAGVDNSASGEYALIACAVMYVTHQVTNAILAQNVGK